MRPLGGILSHAVSEGTTFVNPAQGAFGCAAWPMAEDDLRCRWNGPRIPRTGLTLKI